MSYQTLSENTKQRVTLILFLTVILSRFSWLIINHTGATSCTFSSFIFWNRSKLHPGIPDFIQLRKNNFKLLREILIWNSSVGIDKHSNWNILDRVIWTKVVLFDFGTDLLRSRLRNLHFEGRYSHFYSLKIYVTSGFETRASCIQNNFTLLIPIPV